MLLYMLQHLDQIEQHLIEAKLVGDDVLVAEGILVGKMNKYYEDVCLENQIFVKAENKETVAKYVESKGGSIVSMVRFEVGEGMEKREENFAEEVAKQMNM